MRSVHGVSGHNGEHWSSIASGLGRLLELGAKTSADEHFRAKDIGIILPGL